MSSRTFLVLLHNAKADEWENITGASLASIVSLDVFRELCDRSIIMPSRFSSFITVYDGMVRKKNYNFIGCNCYGWLITLFDVEWILFSLNFPFVYPNFVYKRGKVRKIFLMILLRISAIIIQHITLILYCLLIFMDREEHERALHVL